MLNFLLFLFWGQKFECTNYLPKSCLFWLNLARARLLTRIRHMIPRVQACFKLSEMPVSNHKQLAYSTKKVHKVFSTKVFIVD